MFIFSLFTKFIDFLIDAHSLYFHHWWSIKKSFYFVGLYTAQLTACVSVILYWNSTHVTWLCTHTCIILTIYIYLHEPASISVRMWLCVYSRYDCLFIGIKWPRQQIRSMIFWSHLMSSIAQSPLDYYGNLTKHFVADNTYQLNQPSSYRGREELVHYAMNLISLPFLTSISVAKFMSGGCTVPTEWEDVIGWENWLLLAPMRRFVSERTALYKQTQRLLWIRWESWCQLQMYSRCGLRLIGLGEHSYCYAHDHKAQP